MKYTIKRLSQEIVLELLLRCNNSFTPPLSENIPYTVEEYAIKLSNNAVFTLCIENREIIGFSAFYLNQEGGFAYIPQIWVSDKHQRKGIGAYMIDEFIKQKPSFVNSIRLEVRKNNNSAVSFYKKMGFILLEDKVNKFLLEKIINKSNMRSG